MTGAIFEQVNFKNANLNNTTGIDARFADAQLTGAKFRNSKLQDPDFSGANLQNSDLTGSTITTDMLDTSNYCGAVLRDGFYAEKDECDNI
jgi:uncharacterized protein YjbI with pentapeptide repeats